MLPENKSDGKNISRCYFALGGKQQLFYSPRTRPLFPMKNRATIVLPNRWRELTGEMIDGARNMAF
jgi:hypothetical protein